MPLAGQPARQRRPERRPGQPAARAAGCRRRSPGGIRGRRRRSPAKEVKHGGEVNDGGGGPPGSMSLRRATAAGRWRAAYGPGGVRRDDARLDEWAKEVAASDAQRGRQHPGQRGQDSAISPVQVRACDLTSQHRHLMAGRHDLRVLGFLATGQRQEPARCPDHDQIEDEETPAAVLPQPAQPGQTGGAALLRRVLKRWRAPTAARPRPRRPPRRRRTARPGVARLADR